MKTLQISLTDEEYNQLKIQARKNGQKIRPYVKDKLLIKFTELNIPDLKYTHKIKPELSYAELGELFGISHIKAYHILNERTRDSKGKFIKNSSVVGKHILK